jgi:putative Mg2+ transporter-C (MgtC) family protein
MEQGAGFGQLGVVADVALAMLLGGSIGLERELAGKPAGLRTLMLVAGTSALLVDLSRTLIATFENAPGPLRADPIRTIQAIVIGISFLGAGTIYRTGGQDVEGLTTAATILVASSLGIAVALGQHVVAGGTTLLVLAVLMGLGRFERWMKRRGAAPTAPGP